MNKTTTYKEQNQKRTLVDFHVESKEVAMLLYFMRIIQRSCIVEVSADQYLFGGFYRDQRDLAGRRRNIQIILQNKTKCADYFKICVKLCKMIIKNLRFNSLCWLLLPQSKGVEEN